MSEEVWIEARIKIADFYRDGVVIILSLIKPILGQLKGSIETFYFLYEPDTQFGQCIMFRIKPKEQNAVDDLKKEIEKFLEGKQLKENQGYRVTIGGGEAENYEEIPWQTVQKFFEYCNRLTLIKLDNRIKKGKEFREAKFVHCLLNQFGYSTNDEANFHFGKSIERKLQAYGIFQRLDNLERELNRLKNQKQTD